MTSDDTSTSRRIPVRFVDEEEIPRAEDSANAEPDVYEIDYDATQDFDVAQSLRDAQTCAATPDSFPASSVADVSNAGTDASAASAASATTAPADVAGPTIVELIATRAELRRVESELEKSLSELRKSASELERSEAERRELFDKAARLQSDFENFRKRAERARTDSYNSLVGDVVGRLLPVVDNLQRALDAQAPTRDAQSANFRDFVQGVELIGNQLADVLRAYGVEPVATVGTLFDPHIHEAIATEELDRFPPDTVTAEVVRGYRLGDKLLRPALVKVAKQK